MRSVETVDEGVRVATELYREDLASGHITVLSEMIAGSLDRPDLGPQIVERMEPWIDLTEDAVRNVAEPLGLTSFISPRTIAYAIVALYLGVDLMSHLEQDDTKAEELFDAGKKLAGLLGMLRGPT